MTVATIFCAEAYVSGETFRKSAFERLRVLPLMFSTTSQLNTVGYCFDDSTYIASLWFFARKFLQYGHIGIDAGGLFGESKVESSRVATCPGRISFDPAGFGNVEL